MQCIVVACSVYWGYVAISSVVVAYWWLCSRLTCLIRPEIQHDLFVIVSVPSSKNMFLTFVPQHTTTTCVLLVVSFRGRYKLVLWAVAMDLAICLRSYVCIYVCNYVRMCVTVCSYVCV